MTACTLLTLLTLFWQCGAVPMFVEDYLGVRWLLKQLGALQWSFENAQRSFDTYAMFGLDRGLPDCPYKLDTIECDANGRVAALCVVVGEHLNE